MGSFADVPDLQALGVEVVDGEDAYVQALLDAASDHLRTIIGPISIPSRTVTVNLHQYDGDRWLQIPVPMVKSITSMTVDGYVVVNPVLIDGTVEVSGPADVVLTLVAGLDVVPPELVTWTCVLGSQAYDTLQELGTLGGGGVTSIAMEDFRKTYATVDAGAFALPARVEDLLRNKYGSGVVVVGVR